METEDDGYENEIRYKTADGSRYRYPGKKRGYPGVTSVIGRAWPSGHLEDWRIGNIAAQCIANVDLMRKRFKRIAKKPEKYRELHIPALKELFIGWKDDYSAANRGTRIHRGVELMFDPDISTEADLLQLAPDELSSVEMALAALERLGVEVEYLEVPVYNHDPKYAGTADIIGTFRKTIRGTQRKIRAIIDIKTGKRVNKSYIPQLAAYAKADEIRIGDETRPMPTIHIALVLHVRPDSAQFYQVDIEEGWQDFLACQRIYTSSTSEQGMSLYA